MANWRHHCEECGDPVKIGYEYCFDHKHLTKVEPPKVKFEVKQDNKGHAGRGCKDD